MATATARQEWNAMWPLPFVAMLGVVGSATFAYSSGVFMEAMTTEFGWSRSQFSSAFAVQMVLGLLVLPLVGRFVDRVGPRRIALSGIFVYMLVFSSLGLANGSPGQWLLLGGVQALGVAMVSPPVWVSALVPRFRVSRGMALAIALAGVGVATAIWPIIAALGVETFGWRATFPALAIGWGAIMLPLAWFFLPDPPAEARENPGLRESGSLSYAAALRSSDFILITLAGGIFATVSYGMTLHIVPILHDQGLSLAAAAGLAGLMGICSITGRLGTGFLLDKLPTRPLALVAFLLPVVVSLLLLKGDGNWLEATIAVAILGLSAGAETDIVVYTLSRRFGQTMFASVYAIISALFALFASMGPLLGSILFDRSGNYNLYLTLAIPLVAFAALLMWIVLSPRSGRKAGGLSYSGGTKLT
ncbi:MAG TPA: MFS transporter [Sphingobium sp.]|uniref:MFS transporter n=1 Tax=Sphingobium sp. TaxID=1912891 RepID=UPI002ED1E0EB